MKKSMILGTLLLLVLTALAGCQKVPTPNERLSDYTKLWNKQDFTKMYNQYLSTESKKEYKTKDFASRYKKVYEDLNVTKLHITFDSVKKDAFKNKDKVKIPVNITFETVAGKVSYKKTAELVKEKRDKKTNWYLNWDPSYILPNLTQDDKIQLSEQNPERGEIFDRNGKGLAINAKAYQVGVIPGEISKKTKEKVAKLLGISVKEINQKLGQSWVTENVFVPIKEVPQTEKELLNKLTAMKGVSLQTTEVREYPYGEAAAHLTGYIGNITADELKKLKNKGYTANSVIGKRGLEQLYDEQLRGEVGAKISIQKPDGSTSVVAEKTVKNGKDIHTTIDAALQKKIFNQMKGNAGTASAINPKTGDVLALVSAPSFDPNEFVLGMSNSAYKKLADNKKQPLLNRFALTYAPGSTIKPITGAIALNTGTTTTTATKTIKGTAWSKNSDWGNYKITRVHVNNSPENMEKALILSDNIFFAQTALDIGANKFAKGLQSFGVGENIPFDYPLKDSQISSNGKFSNDIQLADSGYGQGQMQLNILHLAVAYTPFINDGNMIKPHLLKNEKTETWKKSVISSQTANTVAKMLRQVVADPEGTGHTANISNAKLAGKTGTAELKTSKKDKNGKENGLFVAYDANKKNVLISMLIEDVKNHGGSGLVVQKVTNVFR
ncbi:penicillin-binding transpeptidase domain-containing protein [Heyndrickxia ginsengihumi]|uniref:penicillin-binding transpeptidase domain-containing protein n=1 Tax=Heyndrickxia ginsengihumi TaxID=363870 RepID=UPI003D1BE55A